MSLARLMENTHKTFLEFTSVESLKKEELISTVLIRSEVE